MDAARRLAEHEVVDHGAVARHRHGADAGRIGAEVAEFELGAIFSAAFEIAPLRERVAHLGDAEREVLRHQPPEAAVARHRGDVARADRALGVTLAGEGQHRVGPDRDAAVDQARQMHAEERHRRVGHRIDQVADDRSHLGNLGSEAYCTHSPNRRLLRE